MKYTEEMILHSDSGYCMPFEEPQGKDVEMSLGCQPWPAASCQVWATTRYMAFARRSVTAGTR